LKKNTYSLRKWHIKRARNQRRRVHRENHVTDEKLAQRKNNYHRSLVQIWQGGAEETAICTQPPLETPINLCFWANSDKTTQFFDMVRKSFDLSVGRRSTGFVRRSSPKAMPRIPRYYNFTKIDNISMASAIVLAADYDRLKHFVGDVPPTINLRRWNSIVVKRLHQLGYFSILGHEPDPELLVGDDHVRLMRIVRSKTSDDLAVVDESLLDLGKFLSTDTDVLDEKITHCLTIVSEVMSNVTQHAYHPDIDFTYDHLSSFWVSAEANKTEKSLRIVLYDQGSTIPITYPRMQRTDKVATYLRRALTGTQSFDYANDGTYIRAALRYGGSRTDEAYRGKGFPQMIDLLVNLGGGELKVRSRGGWCVRGRNGKITSGSLPYSIGGTLVEWKIEL
jgi:hypothetical protein